MRRLEKLFQRDSKTIHLNYLHLSQALSLAPFAGKKGLQAQEDLLIGSLWTRHAHTAPCKSSNEAELQWHQ